MTARGPTGRCRMPAPQPADQADPPDSGRGPGEHGPPSHLAPSRALPDRAKCRGRTDLANPRNRWTV